MPYATVDKVKLIACASASDLGKSDAEYDSLLSTLITWATGEINAYLGRSYTDDELAADADLQAALESVTVQAVDNWLQSYVQRRNSPIIQVSDFTVRAPNRIILTEDMKKTLDRYRVRNVLANPVFVESEPRFSYDTTKLLEDTST